MRFTIATFVTLVLAVAAMPQKIENNIKQASTKQDIDKGLNLLDHLLDLSPDNKAYCSPYASNGLIPINLGQLLALETDTRFCDGPQVTYACYTESECREIGNKDDEGKDNAY
ncbi:hypothetical protein BJX62DRAFT_244878 [Aspergillus germanicus]